MNSIEKRKFILEGNIYKIIATLSFPIMISNLIQTLYNLVDGIWVSKISTVHFAATSFVWPINFLFVSIGIGLSIAGTSIISQLIGAEKYEECSKYSSQIIAASLLASVAFAIIGYIISPSIISLMGAKGALAEYSNIYLRITFLDMPFMFLYFNYNSIMNAQGNTIQPTVLSAISAVINIVLDPIFIFNLDMGIAGAAIATLISKALLAFAGLYMLIRRPGAVKISFKGFKFEKNILKKVIGIALPSSIGQSGSALGFIVLNSFVVSYGEATLAAFGMVNRVTGLIMQPSSAIGSSITAIIGQNLGSFKMERVKETFKKAMTSTLLLSAFGVAIMLLWDRAIIEFFIQSKDDPSVIEQGIEYLWYVAFCTPLMGIFHVLQGLFQGSGHTRYSMMMEIGRLWFIRIPMILVFKYLTDIGRTGIWFSMSFSNLIICLYGYLVYKSNRWRKAVIR